ncbi:MAG: LysR family transcriptional regulator [Alphaproteobacteria bacterium HGW-Alphaproteobacteria-6]|nr:MAG: LysR family transcriptional regulator [Alphaproteobacteria bacterium HGW-Alphaproteobacteria-6]
MPPRISLRQLDYLVAVCDCGSVAAAAARLNVSSPSISAAIAQAEAAFGLQLFIRRHAHGLTPTRGGLQFARQARRVLAEAAHLGTLAAEITGTVGGPLHVGCLLTFAQIVLPALRRGFAENHPAVTLRQSEGHQAALFEGLRMARIDLALSYDLNMPADLDFQPLVSLPPYALFDPGHELATRPGVSAADLAPYPMVLLDLPMSADYFLSFFTAAGEVPRIAERTADMAVMRGLVANGLGYSIANIRPPGDVAPDGRPLCFVPLNGPVRPMRMGLMLAAGARPTPAAAAFVAHCRAVITPASVPGLRLADDRPRPSP